MYIRHSTVQPIKVHTQSCIVLSAECIVYIRHSTVQPIKVHTQSCIVLSAECIVYIRHSTVQYSASEYNYALDFSVRAVCIYAAGPLATRVVTLASGTNLYVLFHQLVNLANFSVRGVVVVDARTAAVLEQVTHTHTLAFAFDICPPWPCLP